MPPPDVVGADDERWEGLGAPAGLCRTCRHPVLNATRRGTVYLRCGAASFDARLPRHPPLPVRDCVGWEGRGSPGATG